MELLPLNVQGALSSQFTPPLSQPNAATAVADFLEEKIYIADTGNNRILLVRLPIDSPEAVWNAMKQQLLVGNIAGAVFHFASGSAERYRDAYLSIGVSDLVTIISEIPAVLPVVIERGAAQYRFDQVVDGQTITFPIEFVKENGIWKIMEY